MENKVIPEKTRKPEVTEAWALFIQGINGFSEDFLRDGRAITVPEKRESL